MSHNWDLPDDDIPGITDWLHKAGRFREPWEYIGWDTEKQKLQEKAQELGIKLDYQKMLDKIEELQHSLLKKIENIDKLEISLRQRSVSLKEKTKEFEQNLREKNKRMEKRNEDLKKYGYHLNNCTVSLMSKRGRGSDDCTCGWNKLKEEL